MSRNERRPRPARQARRPPPPPRPPVELSHGAPPDARRLNDEGIEWLVWVAGRGLSGTGEAGLGGVEAVHFAHGDQPDRPLLEALISRGSFDGLFPSELRQLRARARPIEEPREDSATAR